MPDTPGPTTPDPGASVDPILELASSVRDLAERVEAQTSQLTSATESFDAALSSHRRSTWTALTAIVIAVLVAVAVGHVQLQQVRSDQRAAAEAAQREEERRRAEERASCLRGNEIRLSVVRAVEVAVARAAARLTEDDDAAQEAAADLAAEVAAAVAADTALIPRDCPGA